MESSADILERFRRDHARDHSSDINLTLRQPYRNLLQALGNPQNRCPRVIHVAGTNGKGSTCAFLRSMLEAAGHKVHVYTSPHLITFHERIRVAGIPIPEDFLVHLLKECEALSVPGSLSYFEVATAVAFAAFAHIPAQFTILETGLGGRLDATNVVDRPLATVITRLSYDHREYLGTTLTDIAREKAGIMRPSIPCFVAPQPDHEALRSLQAEASVRGTPLTIGARDWYVTPDAHGFSYSDQHRQLNLPHPALLGRHQCINAGLAIATLSVLSPPLSPPLIKEGLRRVEWPARLQRLKKGRLPAFLPPDTELWLDGGHNDSAGEVLAAQAKIWRDGEGSHTRPLHIIMGMLSTKSPREFLSPLLPFIDGITTLTIPDEPLSLSTSDLAQQIRALGVANIIEAEYLEDALRNIPPHRRVLICGSLYLAGHVLSCN